MYPTTLPELLLLLLLKLRRYRGGRRHDQHGARLPSRRCSAGITICRGCDRFTLSLGSTRTGPVQSPNGTLRAMKEKEKKI